MENNQLSKGKLQLEKEIKQMLKSGKGSLDEIGHLASQWQLLELKDMQGRTQDIDHEVVQPLKIENK